MKLILIDSINWRELFEISTPLIEIFIRGTGVYLSLFILLRVIFKREYATFGVTDLLVLVLLADAAQNAMAGGYTSITDGILLVSVIIGWSFLLDWLAFKFPFFQRLIKPQKLMLVKNGKMNRRNMRKELITKEELMAEIRTSGVNDLEEVLEAYMESSGEISVIIKKGNDNKVKKNKSKNKALT